MLVRSILIAAMVILAAGMSHTSVSDGAEAQYYVQSALEHEDPPILRMRLVALGSERIGRENFRWWEMTMEKRNGDMLGVRILSSEVPMTSASAPGKITRYIYSPSPGVSLDYRDKHTGDAILPELQFVESFLPHPSEHSSYRDGFATSGVLLGHVLVRSRIRDDFQSVSFENPKILNLRSDLLIASQADLKLEVDHSKHPLDWKQIPYSTEDYKTIMDAGANFFNPSAEHREWIQNEPVFWRGGANYPDDFYRSNYWPSRMYLDEPVIRFGWNDHVRGYRAGPEAFAEAIQSRFEAMQRPSERPINTTSHPESGAFQLVAPPTWSWETHFWSAWYQLAGGSPGTVHEGRYRKRGYGYQPEDLFGKGLERLTDRDMFNFYYAFLRGAARGFDGDWGTAIYSEGDPRYRVSAMTNAYDKGARMIWFWIYDDINFDAQVRWISALMDHVRENPRPSIDEALKSAEVGIAFPPGYTFDENSIWGTDREQLNEYNVRYGDIAAAVIWEGMISSRRGLEYDFLVDHPGIEELGYKQLHIVQKDGSVTSIPPRQERRAPRDLTLSLEPKEKSTAGDMTLPADFRIERPSGKVTVDADFSEWRDDSWIVMDGEPYIFGDSYLTTVTLTVPESVTDLNSVWVTPIVEGELPMTYMGFRYAQMTPELIDKYRLEFWPTENAVVVTEVLPDSPAEQAGLREGDAIYRAGGNRAIWHFELFRALEPQRRKPGDEILLELKRNGDDLYKGSQDISAKVAFMLDDDNLYIAAQVRDDVHRQNQDGWDLWIHDSIQIGFDPILERFPGWYGENNHEIGIALHDDGPIVWRWKGRRGQPVGDMIETAVALNRKPGVEVAVKRVGDLTLYEAAIPVSELAPFAPDMWPKMGMSFVMNDCDGGEARKSRLEFRPAAMTSSKKPAEFAIFECAPSDDDGKLSAALFWDRRCFQPGGHAALTLAVSSPEVKRAKIRTELRSIDDPGTRPVRAETELSVAPQPKEFELTASTSSPPGRYLLSVTVIAPDGRVAAQDELPVYVYP